MIKFNKKAFLVALKNRIWNYAIKVYEDENDAQWTIYLGSEIMKSSNNNKQGFSELQLQQLQELLQPINAQLNKIEVRLDHVEEDIKQIKNCPTIKKELADLE